MPPSPSQFITRPVEELLGRNPGYGFAGQGVSTASGNYTMAATDVQFSPGLLGLLDWTRTYNSLSGAVGPLGQGWATGLSAALAPPAQGLLGGPGVPVLFHDTDGRVLTFLPTPSGGYDSPPLAG
jgi:hypothetical protein